jgi:hypothetical protein
LRYGLLSGIDHLEGTMMRNISRANAQGMYLMGVIYDEDGVQKHPRPDRDGVGIDQGLPVTAGVCEFSNQTIG